MENRARSRVYSVNLVIVLSFALALSYTLKASDWPQFRGPGGQGVAEASGLPVKWGDGENIVWKTKLPGAGASSPIIIGERVYLTAHSGYGLGVENPGTLDDLMLHVLCLEAKDGSIVWDTKVKPAAGEQPKVRDHGYAAQTPASDGEAIYVFFGKTGVFKFDMQGKQLWQSSVGSKTHNWGSGTSPVLFKNLVIVNASIESGNLVALDKATGKEVWKKGGMAESWNTPHIVRLANGTSELVVSVKNKVLAFDPESGKELWQCRAVPDYVCPSIVSREGVIYAIGGRQSKAFAIRCGGKGDVSGTHVVWQRDVGANVSSPAIDGDYLYWASDRDQRAYCLRLSDGEQMYAQKFPAQPYASVLIADGRQYIVTRHKGTVVLAAKPEHEQLAVNKLTDKGQFNASPAVHKNRLYLRSDTTLYCIGK